MAKQIQDDLAKYIKLAKDIGLGQNRPTSRKSGNRARIPLGCGPLPVGCRRQHRFRIDIKARQAGIGVAAMTTLWSN